MNEVNSIENLKTHLKVAIIEKNLVRYSMLNDAAYIDKMSRDLNSKKLNAIDLSLLEKLIRKIGIEEYEIFLKLKEVLEKLDMSEALPSSIETSEGHDPSKEEVVEFILSGIKELQTASEYEEEFEQQLVDSLIVILSKILESLYDKEIKEISEREEYQQLSKEVKKIADILSLIEKNGEQLLSQEEKDLIYEYIINSTIEDKINLYKELIKTWIEQAKKNIVHEEAVEENILPDIEQITPEIAEEIKLNQITQEKTIRNEINVKTEEEWQVLFDKTNEIINETTNLTEEQKRILIKILSSIANMSSEDISIYEQILNESEEISLESRRVAYLREDFQDIVCKTAAIDLIINLIPNLENISSNEVYKIIEAIIDRYNQHYLSTEELQEIKDILMNTQKDYSNIAYITYSDEIMISLEETFKEYGGNIEKLKRFDEYNTKKFQTSSDGWDDFVENAFKKFIKTTAEELKKTLCSNSSGDQIVKGKIPRLRNELEYWIDKYNEYTIIKEMSVPYKQYTIEEIQNIDFGNRNAVIFLNSENGMTLYEEGLKTNGISQNGMFQKESKKKLSLIMKNCINGGKEILSSYSRFKDYVYQPPASNTSGNIHSKKGIQVKINEHNLYRLSEAATPVRITIINLNVPDVNKRKIGISYKNTVVLVIGAHEVNVQNDTKSYANMRREAEKYEGRIKTIISAFENPTTSKETLLKYIANSYGLLEKILGEQGLLQSQQNDTKGGRK